MRRVAFLAKRALPRTALARYISASPLLSGPHHRVAKDPLRPYKDNDDVSFMGRTDTNDSNLHAESVAIHNVVEMPAEDVSLLIQTMNSNYSKSIYALALFDSIDILRLMIRHNLMASSERVALRRWLFNPSDFLRNPALVPEALGLDRWAALAPQLDQAMDIYDAEGSPIAIALRNMQLPPAHWTPVLRWIASEGLESDFKSQLPSFAVAIAEGRGPVTLSFGGAKHRDQRAPIVGRLLMAAGKEFGRVQLGALGTDLIRSANEKVTFKDQKTLTITVGRTSRRVLDWQLRQSGTLAATAEKWNLLHGLPITNPLSSITESDGSALRTRHQLDTAAAAAAAENAEAESRSDEDASEDEDAAVVTDASLGVRPDGDVVDLEPKVAGPPSDDPFTESSEDDEGPSMDGRIAVEEDLSSEAVQDMAAAVDLHFETSAAADAAAAGEGENTSPSSFFEAAKRKSDVTVHMATTFKKLPVGAVREPKNKKALAAKKMDERLATIKDLLLAQKSTSAGGRRKSAATSWVEEITKDTTAGDEAKADKKAKKAAKKGLKAVRSKS